MLDLSALCVPSQQERIAPNGRDEATSKCSLHEDEVEPAAELETDFGHPRRLDKAKLGVKANGDVVLAGDAGDHDVLADGARPLDQRDEKGRGGPLAPRRLGDIDRVLDRKAV